MRLPVSSRGVRLALLLIAGAMALFAIPAGVTWVAMRTDQRPRVKVGILHSLTGTMAISEKPLVDAARMAIDELNARGGVLGSYIEPVIADGRSDPEVFAREAERLISVEHVAALFGIWTSAARRTVEPIVERHDHLLFYPLQYEGLEESKTIVYLGAAPNQQILPAVPVGGRHHRPAVRARRLRLYLPARGQRHHPRPGAPLARPDPG